MIFKKNQKIQKNPKNSKNSKIQKYQKFFLWVVYTNSRSLIGTLIFVSLFINIVNNFRSKENKKKEENIKKRKQYK